MDTYDAQMWAMIQVMWLPSFLASWPMTTIVVALIPWLDKQEGDKFTVTMQHVVIALIIALIPIVNSLMIIIAAIVAFVGGCFIFMALLESIISMMPAVTDKIKQFNNWLSSIVLWPL